MITRSVVPTLLLSVSAYGQMTFISQHREVSTAADSVQPYNFCYKTYQSDFKSDDTFAPITLRSQSTGIIDFTPDSLGIKINYGYADISTTIEPNLIKVDSYCDGLDNLCGCAGSGTGHGEAVAEVYFELGSTTRVTVFGYTSRPGHWASSNYIIYNQLATEHYGSGDPGYHRASFMLNPGVYRFHTSISGGWLGSGCGGDEGLMSLSLSTSCPCIADADLSGGTPDINDIEFFVGQWLAGFAYADADCSGGTPDIDDIDTFFTEWLAGGC